MNSERNSGKRPMSELKNKKGGVSSSCSKNLPPRYLVNTNDYTCVNETFLRHQDLLNLILKMK